MIPKALMLFSDNSFGDCIIVMMLPMMYQTGGSVAVRIVVGRIERARRCKEWEGTEGTTSRRVRCEYLAEGRCKIKVTSC